MKNNNKQGDLFGGYQPEKEFTVKDICKIINGKVIAQQQFDEEVRILKASHQEPSGEWFIQKVLKEGVFWWVRPNNHE